MKLRTTCLRAIVLIALVSIGTQAQDIYQRKQQGFDLANRGQYNEALDIATKIYRQFPDDIDASVLSAFALINLGRNQEGGSYVTNGLWIDPTSYSIYVDAGYYFMAEGNTESAKSYLLESIKLYPDGLNIEDVLTEFRTVGKNVNRQAAFNELAEWYRSTYHQTNERYPTLVKAMNSIGESLSSGHARERTHQQAKLFADMSWHEMAVAVYSFGSQMLERQGLRSEALELAQAGYAYYIKNGCRENYVLASHLLSQLIQCHINLGNDEKAIQFTAEITAVAEKAQVHVFDINALARVSSAYERLGKTTEARKYSYTAYQLAKKFGYVYGQALTANSLCVAFATGQTSDEVNNMIAFGEEALAISLENDFQQLMGAIVGNLSLAYWKTRTVEGQSKSIRTTGQLVRYYKDRKLYADAALTLNNAGSFFYLAGQYDYASNLFEESIQLGEDALVGVALQDKVTFYQSQISAYDLLTACYAHLQNAEKTYQTLEGSRSRVLAEKLARTGKVEKTSLKQLRSMLQPDEACIMYSLFSGFEVVILVITKSDVDVVFHTDENFIGTIKEKYLDRMNKENRERTGAGNDDDASGMRVQTGDFNKVTQLTRKFIEKPGLAEGVLDEYLKGYYSFLIRPVEGKLKGIKRLLISPDNVLNYIPYEALKTSDGKYLVENYDVRYFQSAGVLQQIAQRHYPSGRKSVLAMGGAQFQNMKNVPAPLTTQQELNALQAEVSENAKLGKSQRKAYASLFGTKAMNYLPGTVEEVRKIGAMVPGAEIWVGPDMAENKMKSLSRAGALKNFKVLHLATHGFVVSEIPELSGVAMSIFVNEQAGEDGFLNAGEIASLELNADLAILSACQTALGKIYSGEGVTGLTQSLLVAGANAALVSLWPVNDNSTMLFMEGFYQEWSKDKPTVGITNEMKRRFIRGDMGDVYRHPAYWAPFIYYGQ